MRTIIIILFLIHTNIYSQQIIDRIVAVVGDEIVLESDVETQYLQYLSQGITESENIRCQILEEILYQKLLIHHAKLDSLIISEEEVNNELERRLNSIISQLGSKESLENYYNKTIDDIKLEFYEIIYDQLLSQSKQSEITSSLSITPAEVKLFYTDLLEDSLLPNMPMTVEISQIVKFPRISIEEKSEIRKKLISFRDRINDGEDFKVLATLYSDDTESAKNGGELGFVKRGDLVPEFEIAAFSLKGDEISEIIETKFGYHIIQLISRKDDMINVRHILLKPKVSSSALLDAKSELQKVESLINSGDLTFDDAAINYSDDLSKNNAGILVNPYTGSSSFVIEHLPPDIKYNIENMNTGDISSISQFLTSEGNKAYRIVKLIKKTDAHIANLNDDFTQIHDAALNSKKQKYISDWISEKFGNTYIRMIPELEECNILDKWQ